MAWSLICIKVWGLIQNGPNERNEPKRDWSLANFILSLLMTLFLNYTEQLRIKVFNKYNEIFHYKETSILEFSLNKNPNRLFKALTTCG